MHCWARYLFIAVVSVLGIGQMIAACGQKGDLYLPEPEKETPQQPAAGTAADPPPQVTAGEEPAVESGATAAAKVPQPAQN